MRLEKSHTKFAHHLKEQLIYKKPSPLSISLAFHLIKASLNDKDIKPALYREYRTSLAFWNHPEIKEGIRARLIDRD